MKVTLKNVTKKFGETVAVKDFSAELTDGHLICLLGPSGCGKSTILNMLCGIVDVTQGNIYFDEEEVTEIPSDKRGIGMVFQNYALYPHMTVLENIAFPLEVQKIPKKVRNQKALEIAKLVHVDSLTKRYPSELSGGQQQRVAIARALVKNPKLLLMDEPLSNLDARLRLEMREEIRRIQQETGVTTVFVTHDQEEAMSISDSILLMKDGVLIQSGLCQELYKNPNCKFVAEFLGNPPVNKIELNAEELKKNGNAEILALLKSLCEPAVFENKNLTLAIRPESFVLSNSSSASFVFNSTAKRISQMGKDNIVYFDFSGTEVRGFSNNDEDFSAGDEIKISLKKHGVFLFETETGKRLV